MSAEIEIHPTAVVDPAAKLGPGCSVGAYSVIGADVSIGSESRIGSHVVIEGNTSLGVRNRVFQFASLGADPQDLKFHGEPSTLEIGDENVIREYVTLQPGTEGGGMSTKVGSNNLFMACCHVGHDSEVGDHNVFANSAALSGHVTVGSWVIIGGLSGIHQFTRLGNHSFIGAGAMVNKDIPPFSIAQGDRALVIGLNTVGLKRRGFEPEEVQQLKRIFRDIQSGGGTQRERLESLKNDDAIQSFPAALELVEFYLSSERGVAPARKQRGSEWGAPSQ